MSLSPSLFEIGFSPYLPSLRVHVDKTVQSLTLLNSCSNTHTTIPSKSQKRSRVVISKQNSSACIQTLTTLYSCEPGLLIVMKTLSIVMNTLLKAKQGTSLDSEAKWQIYSNLIRMCTLKCSSFSVTMHPVTLLFNSSTVV